MAVELATAYVSIVPETSKVAPGVYKALGGAEKAASKSGKTAGTRFSDAMGGALKKTAVGVGVAAGAAVGGGIAKGMGRLVSIENAQASLRGLGHDAQSVGSIMENALASVKGTAFGLGEAAMVAASVVAAGVAPGKELERTLKLVGDAATIAGTDMQTMGSIINKVATADMMQMDVANQLMDAGIPILQMVGEEMGVTAEEARKLASAGEVSFEIFQSALEKGVGGAALSAGDTFTGALANMGAALGRVGATSLKPFFNLAKDGLGGVTVALDALEAHIAPFADAMSSWLEGTAVPAVKAFINSLKELGKSSEVQSRVSQLGDVFQKLVGAAKAVAPVVANVAEAIVKAGAAVGAAAWDVFAAALEATAGAVKALAGPLEAITGVLSDHPGVVAAAIAAWAGYKTVPSILGAIQPKISAVATGAKNLGAQVSATSGVMRGFGQWSKDAGVKLSVLDRVMGTTAITSQGAMGAIARAYTDTVEPTRLMGMEGGKAATKIQQLGATAKGIGVAGLTGLKNAASGVMGLFGGPWGVALMAAGAAISTVVGAYQRAENASRTYTEAVSGAEKINRQFAAAAAGTTGELSEQARELSVSMVETVTASSKMVHESTKGWFNVKLPAPETSEFTRALEEAAKKSTGFTTASAKNNAVVLRNYERLLKESGDAYGKISEYLESTGRSMGDLNSIIAEGGPEYEGLRNHLAGLSDGGRLLAEEFDKTRASLEANTAAAQAMDPVMAEASVAVDVLADSSSTADQKLSALKQVLQALGMAPKDATNAMFEAAEAVDSLVESTMKGIDSSERMGSAMLNASGQLDETSANARKVHDSLSKMGDQLHNVAVNGGDVHHAFGQMVPELQRLGQELGFTEEEFSNLLTQYGLTPDAITTLVALEGASEAEKDAMRLRLAIENSPESKTTELFIQDEQAQQKLRDLGFNLIKMKDTEHWFKIDVSDENAKAKLVEFTGNLANVGNIYTAPTVDANTVPATAKLEVVDGQLVGMDGKTATSFAVLEANQLFATADYATAQLMTLDLQRPFPFADLDISSLDVKQVEALQKVGLLDGQTPTPDADMNIADLSAQQQVALAKVFALDAEKPTPISNLDKKQLDAKANDASNQLKVLAKQKTEPVVTAETSQAIRSLNSVLATIHSIPTSITTTVKNIFVREERHTGGVVGTGSRFASGGRIPVGAPGSHTTDGILGVNEQGMPTAMVDAGEWVINRRSSAKYHGLLDAINRDDSRLDAFRGRLPGYTSGGVVTADELSRFVRGENVRGHQASRSLQGAPYVWGGVNWGDCSGAMSAIARFAVGLAPFAGRFATANQRGVLSSMGFTPGKGHRGDLRFAWYNGGAGGGHTWGELPDGTAVEMRGGGRGGIIGGDAWRIDNGRATDFAHLPISVYQHSFGFAYGEDSAYEFGGHGGGTYTGGSYRSSVGDEYLVSLGDEANGAADYLDHHTGGELSKHGDSNNNPLLTSDSWSALSGSVVAAMVSGQVADMLDVFGIPNRLPPLIRAGQQWFQKAREKKQDQRGFEDGEKAVIDAAESVERAADADYEATLAGEADTPTVGGDTNVGPARDATAVSAPGVDTPPASTGDSTKDAVKKAVTSRGWDSGAQWEALDFIITKESGWSPTATNPSSGAFGLFQLNPASGTLQEYMPSRSTDPAVQAEAGAKYIEDRYGDPVAARAFWEKNHWYDSGGRAHGIGVMLKNTLKPERVLSPAQTKAFEDLVFDQMPHIAQASETITQAAPQVEQATQAAEMASTRLDTGVVADQMGAVEATVAKAIPTLLESNSLSDIAGMVVSNAVRAGGSTLTNLASSGVSMAGNAVSMGLSGVGGLGQLAGVAAGGAGGAGALGGMATGLLGAGIIPTGALAPVGAALAAGGPTVAGVSSAAAAAGPALAGLSSLATAAGPLVGLGTNLAAGGVNAVGGTLTEIAAWYSGQVASGVVGALEGYVQEVVGATPLGMFQDAMKIIRPVVGAGRHVAGIGADQLARLQDSLAAPVETMATNTGGGDVYNFNAVNVDGLMSHYRRETAKHVKGVVGAR